MTKTNILMASLSSGGIATVLGIVSTITRNYGSTYSVSGDLLSVAVMVGLFGIVSGFVGYAYPADSGGGTGTTTSNVSKGA